MNELWLLFVGDRIQVLSADDAFSWFGLLFPTIMPSSRAPKLKRRKPEGIEWSCSESNEL